MMMNLAWQVLCVFLEDKKSAGSSLGCPGLYSLQSLSHCYHEVSQFAQEPAKNVLSSIKTISPEYLYIMKSSTKIRQ